MPFEATQILQISILSMAENNTIIWHPNKKGLFTVKSAYHCIKSRKGTIASNVFFFNKHKYMKLGVQGYFNPLDQKIKSTPFESLDTPHRIHTPMWIRQIQVPTLGPIDSHWSIGAAVRDAESILLAVATWRYFYFFWVQNLGN